MAVDDAYTKALLHFDGTDASTTFTDESGKSWTAGGNAQLDTAQIRFGTASGLFDGTGDFITTAAHADFQFGSGDFTIDCWIRITANPAAIGTIFFYGNDGNVTNATYLILNTNGTLTGYIRDGASNVNTLTSSNTVPANAWTHVAFLRSGGNLYMFINGLTGGTATANITIGVPDTGPTVNIGRYYGPNNGTYWFPGWIDEIRISKGIGRWTGEFTPYNMAYPRVSKTGFFNFM